MFDNMTHHDNIKRLLAQIGSKGITFNYINTYVATGLYSFGIDFAALNFPAHIQGASKKSAITTSNI